ncbi:MAG: HupE/UreJ family protein [Cyanobacteria bacterium]|jgi:urease accessory protein|nr:HupE/UreJ family protein [Cyanobacteriota bacterium]MDA1205226.1 HupE/UreJ family protein [Cyanobacteriota bacterium]
MKRFTAPLIATAAGAVMLLGTSPVLAHGAAAGGALGGLTHPLLGLDHLFMLMAVGTAAALISARLLVWALAGAVLGAAIGLAGLNLPSAEVMAALSISAVAGLSLLAGKAVRTADANGPISIRGAVVGSGVAIHAMLHGLESPQDGNTLIWWSGALLSSALVCAGTCLLLKKLPPSLTKAAAITLTAIGGLLAIGQVGLLAG